MVASWSDFNDEENPNEDDGGSDNSSNFLAFMENSQIVSEQGTESEEYNFKVDY